MIFSKKKLKIHEPKKQKNMKQKLKSTLREVLCLLGFSFIFGVILCRPYIKEFFKENYYVIDNSFSATQKINQKNNNIEVEFRCSENEFQKFLSSFKSANKEFYEIDTSIDGYDPFDKDSQKSFIVTFLKK